MFKTNDSSAISAKTIANKKSDSSVGSTRFSSRFFQLKNGLGLGIVSFPGIKTVSLRAFVFVGSVYENSANSGISHFLEHMVFRGNEKLGDARNMSVLMEELGGEFNAATSFDQTEYWLDIHRDYVKEGIERFCQFLQYPLFEQIEVERSIILEEIIGDYNEDNNLVDLDCLTSDLLWPDHPMGMPITGNVDTVKNISRKDLIDWHQQYYIPSNMIIGVTGDVNPDEIAHLISNQFTPRSKRLKRYQTITATPKPERQVLLVADKDNQFGIQWSFPSYSLDKTLRIEYELLRRILDGGNSSRLQRLIREDKGLVYDISLDTTYFDRGMIMSLQSVVGINKLNELLSSLVDLIEDLMAKGVTQAELDLAKLRYRIALECSNDTAQGILYNTLMSKLNPAGASSEQVIPALKKISLRSINRTLMKLLDQELTTFVLVGPWTNEHRQLVESKLQRWTRGNNIS